MKKFISSVLLMVSSVSFAGVPVLGAPVPGVNSLRENVLKSFLQKANNSRSPLHKKLEQLNQDHTDGRNQNGVLPKTLTATNIQVVSIGGEDEFGSYCSAIEGKPGHTKCKNGVSETYLLVVPYRMGVHKAVEYESLKFVVKASKSAEWKRDEHEKEYDRQELIEIGDPSEISVEPG